MRNSELVKNVRLKKSTFRTFVINPLVHIHQTEKIAPEIAVKIAGVNQPLKYV